jgi:hypothetical protein
LLLYNSSGSNTVLIRSGADSYLTGGNLGIGTSSPAEKLDVAGQVRIAENGLSKQHLKLVDSNATSKFGQIGFDNGILRIDSLDTSATGTQQALVLKVLGLIAQVTSWLVRLSQLILPMVLNLIIVVSS